MPNRLWSAFRHPVHPENRAHLRELWRGLPPELRTPRQLYGRHGEGCGATIGVMPRCDFRCTGCYLAPDADDAPPASLQEVRAQMRTLRRRLGRWGNLQITDGEVTLRPVDELIELVRSAREVKLLPMLMTHGDVLLRDPSLLERLVLEGGLREISFHVDTTQRGRRDPRFRGVEREEQLDPLRDAFADLVRRTRRRTGRPLAAATTVTVTRDNLDGVPAIAAWLRANADAFRVASFQPLAPVGRTRRDLSGVTADELWDRLAAGLLDGTGGRERLERGQAWFGHPDCTRCVLGFVAVRPGRAPAYHPLRDAEDVRGERTLREFLQRFGGVTFRPDSRPEAVARGLGMLARSPAWFARRLPATAWSWLRRIDSDRPLALAADLLRGRARLQGLSVVSHHFMGRAELETRRGRERLAACTFVVPDGDRFVPMCAANALGARDATYARLRDPVTEGSP